MNRRTALDRHLWRLGACADSRAWIGERTPEQAWEECARPDWLLWWAVRTKVNSDRAVVLAICACARMVVPYVPLAESRPLRAIEAAERHIENPTEGNAARRREASNAAAAYAWSAYRANAFAIASAAYTAVWASSIRHARVTAHYVAIHVTSTGIPPELVCAEIRGRLKMPYTPRARKEAQP